MANDRIFYACQGVAIQNCGKTGAITTGEMVHGLQSIGVNTNFNLEQAFELGQIAIYENIEGNPEVEVTMEKVIDGYPLIYHLATTGVQGAPATGLLSRSKQKCQVILGIYPDTNDAIDTHDDPPPVEVYMSGLYVSSLSYTFPVDGNCTESVTLVGNHKKWFTANGDKRLSSGSTNNFDNLDEPLNSGIDRRQDVLLDNCEFPTSIYGITTTGVGNAVGNAVPVHVQNVTISTDLGREDILELGRKMPYARPATFPVEVTCEIEVIATSGDFVNALEDGDPAFVGTKDAGNNTKSESIQIATRQGLIINLGNKNRLQSVSYGGGDAGGGNVSCTYSYVTYNTLDVELDPGLLV